jgi:hypothetical protein
MREQGLHFFITTMFFFFFLEVLLGPLPNFFRYYQDHVFSFS